MRIFKNKGEFTKFQILAKIAQQEPHLKQKILPMNWESPFRLFQKILRH